ncbi:uncharacterized protein BCR38DRAFT_489446 [Pseudomassariella vexata]|uniref:Uncharacterized protein n=1 Tax=Pseudomassariella vexata TaxID=1141098 RepID=A0A1Y2DGY6_9PEZI|nr:uncharacterized protein BCR38DRAFT_489446 [Pseudomassariella vexata]ORY58533.1 hypothetical protein BCR38DRAFT_489446 [Pseudomassariella vexata]
MDTVESLRPNTEDLWKIAVKQLPEEDKACLDVDCPDRRQIVARSLELTNNAKQRCERMAWRFKRKSGEVVIARDVLAKVARWIEHFKAVGDTIVQYDPAHAALPWAGVRFVLQICVDHFETHAFLLEAIPAIAQQICRCALMEELLMPSLSDAAEELKRALVKLYASILTYQARVKAYFQKSTTVQILQSLQGEPSKFESAFKAILDAQADVERCFQIASVQEQLKRLAQLKDAFAKLEIPINRWSDGLVKITDKLDRLRRKDILQWISEEQYLQHHKREQESFLEGTGEWLLSNPVFKQWKEESASSILWLHGILGSGKSKLTSLVIEDAREAFQKQQALSPAFFYCSRNPAEPGRSDPEKIIASIVRQLSSVGPGKPILQPKIAVYQSHEDQGFAAGSLQIQDSSKLLLQLLENYPTATIIIDALDECRADTRHKLLECLEHILRESSTLVKIFVSSRDDQDIVCKLQNYPGLELSSHLNSNDIARFVQFETKSLVAKQNLLRLSRRKDELSQKIIRVVSDGADGMFRWASLQLQALCELKSDDAILERLGRLPSTLEELYQEIADKIKAYDAKADRQYAVNAPSWLLCSRRRLSSEEFLAAVSTSPSQLSTALTKYNVLDLCCNLIVFDSTLDEFRFAHLSVREFLETKEAYASTAINSIAAQCCLTALMPFKEVDISKNGLAKDYETNRLYKYASIYWAPHCHDAAEERRHGHLSMLLETFLSDLPPRLPFTTWNSEVTTWIDGVNTYDRKLIDKLGVCQSGDSPSLFVASAFDFAEVIQIQLREGALLKGSILTKCTVITASFGCYEALLELLGSKEVKITEDVVKAAAGNYRSGKEVMALLLEKRGDQVQITEDVVKAAARNMENGKEFMALLLEKRGDQVQITEDVVKAAAGNYWSGKEVMALLLEKRGDQVQITEDVVKAAAGNRGNGKEVMALLLEKRGDQVQITEDVVKAAAGNRGNGKEVMALLLEKRGDQVQITEDVVKAAAGNYRSGKEAMALLLEKRGDQVQITEDVVKAAARNMENGKVVMALLLEKRGDQVQITEDVVKAAAGNYGSGKEVMALLLEKRGDQVQITEDVVKAAARNMENGKEFMALLLEKRGDQVQITEDVVKAAAGNRGNGKEVMALLLEKRGDQVQITEDVVKAAAGNYWSGKKFMALLLEKRGDQVQITEDVVKAAAGNGKEIMALLLEKRGDQVQITEDVVKAAAGNRGNGKEVMALLLEKRGDQVHITEDVVKAAAGNYGSGKKFMALLLDKRGDQVQITEDVVKAAAGNGKEIMALLLKKRGDQVQITEDVVKAAAGNGKEIMALLIRERREDVVSKLTDDVCYAAATSGQYGVLDLLSRLNGLSARKDEWCNIAIFYNASQSGNLETVTKHLFQEISPDLNDTLGRTPLWVAASRGHKNIVEHLVQRTDIDINSRSISGRPPIFWPSAYGNEDIVKILVGAGADPNVEDIDGETPISMARKNGHITVVEILEKSGTCSGGRAVL